MNELTPKQLQGILFPTALTMMHHCYLLMQMRVLVVIVRHLQPVLYDVLNGRRSLKHGLFRLSEVNENGCILIRFRLSETGITPNHYAELQQAIVEMTQLPVDLPVMTNEGKQLCRYKSLLTAVRFEDNLYNNAALVALHEAVAVAVCGLETGYHHLRIDTVFGCRVRYAPHLYMLAAHSARQGFRALPVAELRSLLRLDHSYSRFSDLLRRVLRPAEADLHRLAKEGRSDLHVRIECLRAGKTPNGEPQTVLLHVIQTDGDSDELTEARREQVIQMLTRYFGFSTEASSRVAKRVTQANYQLLMTKLTALHAHLLHTRTVRNRPAYVFRSIEPILKPVLS